MHKDSEKALSHTLRGQEIDMSETEEACHLRNITRGKETLNELLPKATVLFEQLAPRGGTWRIVGSTEADV
ncbi:MAG: hypothetical protein ABIE14_05590 [Patescibacteria group bacterium]